MPGEFDIAIVGSGPGGYVAALKAAQGGARVAMIEREELGGTCLNVGCIPSKALLASAERLHELRNSAALGIRVDGEVGFDYTAVLNHKERTVRQLRAGVDALLRSNGVQIVQGQAQFLAPDCLQIGTAQSDQVSARNIIIATGSTEARPPIPGLDTPGIVGSRQALSLPAPPASLTIVGGSALGCEFASIFSHFGSKVTIVEALPRLLPVEDTDLGKGLARIFERQGIAVKTGTRVARFEPIEAGVRTTVSHGDREESLDSEMVLTAIGRVPYTEGLGLERVGVRTERNAIVVDDAMRTTVPGIWAIGDVTGRIQLAHVASAQAEVAVSNILGESRQMDYSCVPSCVYTIPQVSSVGLSEERARLEHPGVRVGTFPFQAIGRAIASRNTEGFVKIVADQAWGRVLGVHILHSRASDLIEEAVLAMRLESSIEDIVAAIHPHPTFGEALAEAALVADNRPLHIPRRG